MKREKKQEELTVNFGLKECSKCEYQLRCRECVYHEQLDVAKAIFEELDTFIVTKVIDHGTITYDIGDKYKELKKKYTEEGK